MPANHTPGPLIYRREGTKFSIGTEIKQLGYHGLGIVTAHTTGSSEVAEADARLYTAAPDLLDALRSLMSDYCTVVHPRPDEDEDSVWVARHYPAYAAALKAIELAETGVRNG